MIRKTMTVLLAISVIVLSISAAFAADGGVFGEVAAREGEYADKRLSVLDQIAEKPAASQTLEDGIAVLPWKSTRHTTKAAAFLSLIKWVPTLT